MWTFIEQIANGLTLGTEYASVAIGLALIFGVVRQVNFAHGEWFMVGAYVFFFLYAKLGLPYPVAVPLCAALMVLFGLLFERVVVRPVESRAWYVPLITTLAASIVLSNGAALLLSPTPRTAPTPYLSQIVTIGEIHLSTQRIIVLALSVGAFLLLDWFLRTTKSGKAMRAMSQNREACSVVGIDVRRVTTTTFGLSGALVGLGAALIVPLYNIQPTMGTSLIFRAFAIVIMGGFGQVKGTIYSALLLGVLESLVIGFVSSEFVDAIGFGLIILVLIFRPQGLFGRRVGLG